MDANEIITEKLEVVENSEAIGIIISNPDNVTWKSEPTIYAENAKQDTVVENFTIDKKGDFEIETNVHNKQKNEGLTNNEKDEVTEATVKITKPLCADYRSDSDTDSDDTDSDSSTSSAEFTSETTSDSEDDTTDSEESDTIKSKKSERKSKTDFSLSDLPPIEDLRISVPEDACTEIGTIMSIVDALVVVESYKGTPALDVDTVLFLDKGKRTLGKVFDILGPVAEPVYAVRFNSEEQIKNLEIEKGLKVYCAPKTQHTSFVFISEVMKHKGSDASWKDNIEAPSEFQDFSDDEEERRHRVNRNTSGSEDGSRKRPFSKSTNVIQPGRFRPLNPQARPNRFSNNHPRPFIRPGGHHAPMQPFPYTVPLYPGHAALTGATMPLPQMYYPPRFSGPPFPNFAFGQSSRFPQPFYQQRTHAFAEGWRMQFVIAPPPPPPPHPPDNGEKPLGQS